MHTLHFILLNADSADDAADQLQPIIADWGNENYWRYIGGIASEDGLDDVENHEDARWALSDFPQSDTEPRTAFDRISEYCRNLITGPITLRYEPSLTHDTIADAVSALAGRLAAQSWEAKDHFSLWKEARHLTQIAEYASSLSQLTSTSTITEHYAWQFDEHGLTDLTQQTNGRQRYLLFLDMHS